MQNTDPERLAQTIAVTTGLGVPVLDMLTEYVSSNALLIGIGFTAISVTCQIYFSFRGLSINQRRFDIEGREKLIRDLYSMRYIT